MVTKLKCFRGPSSSVIEIHGSESDDKPATKKVKTKGAFKLNVPVPGKKNVSVCTLLYLVSLCNVVTVFSTSDGPDDVNALLSSMKGMSLSPEHGCNGKGMRTPFAHPPVTSNSRSAGNYTDSTFHFALPKAPPVKCLPPPVEFVEPSFDNIIFRRVPDPTNPASAPHINPWSKDYFLGDI
ncbi:hypothetical protein PAXRUDRAFT_17166 [Paxillus rubicundulus Ve08.2h10]|uniref:Uncharacterized protein n=1 Tax=Paxillus rubicundulus Ve08.2h10 TaxID=930991 RepID=A0A0D0DIP4_9AGAM|nr:hypothetical protein PAXRUDRAFT_17166 [Paxillus rubicundulus Ve08.2h10]